MFPLLPIVYLPVRRLVLLVVLLLLVGTKGNAAARNSNNNKNNNKNRAPLFTTIEQIQKDISNYRSYPNRHRDEAAVIEWGHSAIISAIDASVAFFGPQTSDAAVLEVETSPILGDPIDGIIFTNPETKEGAKTAMTLKNAKEVHGNVVVMTDIAASHGSGSGSGSDMQDEYDMDGVPLLSCLDLAIIAQNSKAAALIIVHINEDRPDNAPRCTVPIGRETEATWIDIPVVTISLSSIDLFTSATVNETTKPEDVINHGMPERIRLYAGGERPFFEDIETIEPTVYMIHNLLSLSECQTMMEQANQQTFRPIQHAPIATTKTNTPPPQQQQQQQHSGNPLVEYMTDTTPYRNIDRTVLHPGFFQSLIMKAVDERIEQVTGFPLNHYSEWVIDRLTINSTIDPHYDNTIIPSHLIPHATITVFLNDLPDHLKGGHLVYPSIGTGGKQATAANQNTDPIQIRPTQGLGIVHHNTDEKQLLEFYSLHAVLPITTITNPINGNDDSASNDVDESSLSSNQPPYLYVARKYILPVPISKLRRYTIPMYLLLFGRHGDTFMIKNVVTQWYMFCMNQFSVEDGNLYFDYSIVGVPILIIGIIVVLIGYQLYIHFQPPTVIPVSVSSTTTTPKQTANTKSKSSTATTSKKNGTKKKN